MSQPGTQPGPESLYDPDLTQWLQLAGEYIGHVRPADERVGWVMFLFDQVKPFMPEGEYREFVAAVAQALHDRNAQA